MLEPNDLVLKRCLHKVKLIVSLEYLWGGNAVFSDALQLTLLIGLPLHRWFVMETIFNHCCSLRQGNTSPGNSKFPPALVYPQ
jgi:hypothetical protein